MKRITLREIAEHLGVSAATVSIVLNDKDGVSAETRKRVKEYLIKANYPIRTERKMKPFGNVFLLKYAEHGMIVEENQGFIAAIIDQIQKDFLMMRTNLTIVNCTRGTIENELERVSGQKPLGVILVASELDDSHLDMLESIKGPLAVVDHSMRYRNIDSVVMANEAIAFNAVRYLFSIGHREIGHLRSAIAISNFNERRAGFEEAMNELQLKATHTIPLTPTLEGSYRSMREYLNEHAESLRATAFFADNDAIAIGAIRALQENGVHVPDDLSVIGVDDIPFSAINNPPLTTMRVSRTQLAHLTVDILTQRIKKPDKPACHYLNGGTLIVRTSTRPR